MKKPLTILALVCLPLLLQADEFVYDANVVRSEPVTTTRVLDRMPAECLIGKPATGSMGALLEWDVGCDQPQTIEVRSYRIIYEVEGESFVAYSDVPPGKTLPVRISLN